MNGPTVNIKIELPQRFHFLLEPHPYKVGHGGRDGLKSWSFADAILALGGAKQLRIVCGRQVMKSLADSVHKLLSDRIEALALDSFYRIIENKIRGANGTEITYAGLSDQTADSIKSFEGVNIFWVEEAQNVTESVWKILLPTIRAENSEVWISFNPDLADDPTYQRWVVNPPPGTVVRKTTYEYTKACGFFTDKMEALRAHDEKTLPTEEYRNIWLGEPRTTVAGAIYAREIIQCIEEGRIRPIPYDPRLPVHTIWDLGWNDAMSIIMVQKPVPSALNVINYLEDTFLTYAQYVADLNALRYTWGDDWLPHDGKNKDPKAGMSAKQVLEGLGRRVKIIGGKDDHAQALGVEEGIRAARMMFPRVYIDNSVRKRATGYLGAQRLVDCLKRYRRSVPVKTGEPSTPVHDAYSHAADAWRGLATIVDRIKNDGERKVTVLPGFSNADPSMGMLS